MANNIAKSIINGTYGINKEKEEKLPISKQILNGTFTPSSMLPTSNYYTRGSIKMGRSSNKNKALSSLENMLFLTGKGTSQALEGILDTTNYLSSKVNSFGFNLLGRKDLAEKEQKNKQNFIQRNLTNELGDVTGLTNRITENEQAGSVFKRDNLPGQVVQAVGGQIPTLAVGSLSGVGKANTALQASKLTGLTKFGTTALINAPTTTTLATRSFGGALEEAYNNGASESEAVKYAIGSTATEIATEWITGGIPGTSGKGGLDYFADKGIDKISNQLVKDLVKYGYKMVGEGVEEGIAEIITPYLKNATYSSGEKVNWNDVINSTIVGGLLAGIIEAPMTVSNIRNDVRNIKTQNLANQNSKSVNKTVNEIVQQEQKTNSATMPNAKIPRLMPKTNSGTSSLYINDSTNLNNGQIIPLTKNLQNVENNNANMNTLNNNMEVNNIFSNQVDEVLKGTFDKNNHMTVLEHTPEVLQKLGIQDYPITLTASKLDRIMNESGSQKGEYHNLGVDTVKKLPQALQNPLDIVKSHNNSYVLTTDLSDNQNRQVIASIKIDGKGYINNIEIDTNVMTSAYGRNNYDSWMKRHQDKGEIVYDVDRGYIDTKKLDIIPRLQLSNNNIKYSKSDVNDRVQFPMRDSSSNSTSDIIKNISPISYNNDSIKSDKSQILMPSTNINMQNNENNTNNRLIPQDPTKESTYMETENIAKILKERPVTQEDRDNKLKKLLTIKILDKGYYVDKTARKYKNRELSSKYDYMLQANGIAQQVIGNERFNPKTQKIDGKGLYKIFEPIENSGQLQEFSEYMYHKHNIDRMNLENTYNESNKPIFGETVTSEASQEIVNNYEKNNPHFKEWAKEIYDYNNFLLDILVDYGIITSDDKLYYNKKYPNYVPTIRATDKTKVQMDMISKKASINIPIKKAKGGNQDIIPLKEAIALRTMQTMNSALRNNFGNELYNTLNTEAETNNVNLDETIGDNIDVEDYLTKSTNKNPATLTIFKDGKKVTFNISDEIYEALAPSQRYKFNIFNKISQIRRGLLTEFNPAFMFTNPIKDIQDGALNSKHSTLFLRNIPEAVSQIKNKGQYYKQYIANGGSYETYFNYGDGYNQLPVQRARFDPRRVLDKISTINQYIEMTPRLAEFISSIEAGDSLETAMYNAQEITTNFKRGGNWTKNLDANGVTFLNASVQGAVKQIRNIQEAKAQGIKGVTNLAVKWSVAGLTPYLLSQLLWGDDDDYEELSDYVKNNYYLLWKNDDATFVRIPKGRVMSVIQNLFEQPLNSLKGDKIDIPEFLELLQNQVLPSDPTENNIFSPILDVAQNKTWYGGDLVSQSMQNLPSSEQYDESTDSLSIWIGQKTGLSPIKINYILDQYSGAIGDIILPTLTLEAENDSNSFLSNLFSPLKDKFTTNSITNNQNMSDLYDLDDKLTKLSKSANATSEDILKSKYINSIQTKINKLTAEQREIQNDKSLTNNEKYKQVLEKQKEINKLAKEGINNYNDIESYDNYGSVAGVEYYLNSKNEWTKVDDKESKELENLNMNGKDKDKYFETKVKIGVIKSNENIETSEKKQKIGELVISSKLSDKYKGFLYGKYYSSEEEIENIEKLKIDIDEFIKFNSQNFESDYNKYTGESIANSRKIKVIKYVNGLNLNIAQKALLIKSEYQSYDNYDAQIFNYINDMEYSKYEKASLLKQYGFDEYDQYLIEHINSQSLTIEEKTEILKRLGFTVRDGRVYSK